jgi:hypothetical protein
VSNAYILYLKLTVIGSSATQTDRTLTSRPEGWWSSDEVGNTEPNTPPATQPAGDVTPTYAEVTQDSVAIEKENPKPPTPTRLPLPSRKKPRVHEKGITIDTAKAVGGLNQERATVTRSPISEGSGLKGIGDGKQKKRKKGPT